MFTFFHFFFLKPAVRNYIYQLIFLPMVLKHGIAEILSFNMHVVTDNST